MVIYTHAMLSHMVVALLIGCYRKLGG